MKIKQTILVIILLLSVSKLTFGQSNDLNIFGYYQINYTNFNVFSGETKTLDVNSFLMQQMNVFFQKNLTTELSSFVNLEFTNSFSFQDTIGGFKIEEAWLKYSPSSLFNVKAGVLTPRFNNFNEIKNRTILLPYLYRPIAYETYFFDQFGTGEFVPTTANLQVYGEVPVGDLSVNYAAFYGNSETGMLNRNSNFWGPGQDPTPYKMVGGRLGFEYGDLQLGASITNDKKRLDTHYNGFYVDSLKLGYVTRTRFGTYLNYSIAGFELEAELIKVYYDIPQDKKDALSMNPMFPSDFDKTFAHVNLLYNIFDNLSAYVGYDYLKGKDNFFISDGLKIYSYGACFRASDAVLLKGEYAHQNANMWGSKLTRNDYLLGASVSF